MVNIGKKRKKSISSLVSPLNENTSKLEMKIWLPEQITNIFTW